MVLPPLFMHLSKEYLSHGHKLYLVGGAVRDLLLGRMPDDLDFATDATPSESLSFMPDLSIAFVRFGVLKYEKGNESADIVTFRKEGLYRDRRHPGEIIFIRDPEIDSLRRDFTINAMYMGRDGSVLDFHGGQKDLHEGIVRFIGDPKRRIKEDPLRICRAERFAETLGFAIDPDAQKAIDALRPLLKELNPDKLREERRKGWKGTL